MIGNQLYQVFQVLIAEVLRETINQDLIPLISKIGTENRRLMTYTEAIAQLRISKPVFYRLLRERKLRKVVIDKRTFRIDSVDLLEFIESRKN